MILQLNQLRWWPIAVVLSLSLFALGCKDSKIVDAPIELERGELVSTTPLGTYSPAQIQQILAAMNANLPYPLTKSVQVISVQYASVDGDGKIEHLSGALMIPSGTTLPLPLLSLQHGTQTKRDLVASQSPVSSVEGIVGLVSGSIGYVTVVPDYPGFGISNRMHPYLHASSLVPGVVDFMRAARSYCSSNGVALDGRIFLSGYSEGGYVTLAAQRGIEKDYSKEFNLVAVAPMAGPYDLRGTMLDILQKGVYSTPGYIAFVLTAYDKVYKWNRLSDFFKSPYASRMPGLFDGSKTWGEVVNQLPSSFSELMNPDFVARVLAGTESAVISSIEENTLLNWVPKAPLHFFHGDADDVSPYQNAVTAVATLTANGGTNIKLTTIPGGNHSTASLPSVLGAIGWFESIRTGHQGKVARTVSYVSFPTPEADTRRVPSVPGGW